MKAFLPIVLLLFFQNILFADKIVNEKQEAQVKEHIDSLQKPLYNAFTERYILDEIKTLRDENRNLKNELYERLAKKEVDISNNAINYATSTINNMFYIIAAASSILVLMGWSSIRDMNEKVKGIVDEKVSKIIDDYESRMSSVETDLAKRSKQVLQNQKAIQETNTIHSLWVRAAQENTPSGQVEVYDEILSIRPDDVEALTYKAESILELGEANWALSLANQALNIDEDYAHGLYQRAKAQSVLGNLDEALSDLQKAFELNEEYVLEADQEKEFVSLKEDKRFRSLLKIFNKDNSIS